MTYQAQKTIFWLFAIEYATLNTQEAYNAEPTPEGYHQGGLGAGVTNLEGAKWNAFNGYNPFIPCGYTDELGNGTGIKVYDMPTDYSENTVSVQVPRYRGIENPFGHIWKWTDGVLGKGVNGEYQEIYVSRNPSQYASAVNDSYVDMGREATGNGFCKAILASDPSHPQEQRVYGDIFDRDDSGSSDIFFCDYYYKANVNNSIYGLRVGGGAFGGAGVGLACLAVGNVPADASADVGSRLCWSE